MRIATKTSLGLSALALVLFGVITAAQLRAEREDLLQTVEEELGLLGSSLRTAIENAMRDRQLEDVHRLVDQLTTVGEHVDVVLLDAAGAPGAGPEGARALVREIQPFREAVVEVLRTGTRVTRYASRDDVEWVATILPTRDATRRTTGAVAVVRRLDDVDRDLADERRLAVSAVIGFSLLAGLLAFALGELWIGRPLARLGQAMRAVRAGNLQTIVDARSRDEVSALGEQFNTMVEDLALARSRLAEQQEAHRRAQRALQDAERLITVGQLSAGLAHEIGSPLQVLRGRTERLLKSELAAGEVRRNLEVIAAQTHRITGIVEQLLKFARAKPPRLQRADPVAAIQAVIELLELEARRGDVTLMLEAEAVGTTWTDPDQLQQIVMNLVRNALQATPAEGVVAVRVGGDEGGLEIRVHDSGRGVPPEIQDHLFEPFFTTRASEGGTGLGLAVVHSLVTDLGGTVSFEPGVPSGSTFVVRLPGREAVAASAEIGTAR